MVRQRLHRKKVTQVKTPGGQMVYHFRRKPYGRPQCALCGEGLLGVPRGSPAAIKKLTKTQRRPTRPFGGQLCTVCTRKAVSLKLKLSLGIISIDDVPISMRSYVQ